jgi:hypothetical protein
MDEDYIEVIDPQVMRLLDALGLAGLQTITNNRGWDAGVLTDHGPTRHMRWRVRRSHHNRRRTSSLMNLIAAGGLQTFDERLAFALAYVLDFSNGMTRTADRGWRPGLVRGGLEFRFEASKANVARASKLRPLLDLLKPMEDKDDVA